MLASCGKNWIRSVVSPQAEIIDLFIFSGVIIDLVRGQHLCGSLGLLLQFPVII
jgi:hypothetical protein